MHLPDDVASLQQLLREVLAKLAALEAENAELRRRLGLHSGNSHKPPSSDAYKKKNSAPALPKEKSKKQGG